jgi:hypothetical protein
MIEPLKNLAETLLALSPERRSWVFAHIGVPAVILALVFIAIGSTAPILDLDSRIAVIPLRNTIGGGAATAEPRPGLAVIVEPHAAQAEYRIPWKNGGTAEVWTSLDGVTKSNSGRIRVENGMLSVEVPFFNDPHPVVIIASGDPEGYVDVLNRRIPVAHLMLASRRSVALAMWMFVAAVFAAALTSVSGWRAAPTEHRRRKKRASDKKRQVV